MSARILFVALTNDVGSDRIVIEAGARDAACAVLGPPNAYAALPRCVSARFPIESRFGSIGSHLLFAGTFGQAVSAWQPDFVVPLDDLSATLLRLLGRDRRTTLTLRMLIERSLGASFGYDAACHRVALMQAAARAGVRTPLFAAAASTACRSPVGPVGFPLMVKRDQSSGSGGVVRVESQGVLARALRTARLKTAAKAAIARLAGFHRSPSPVLLQQVVDGRLAMFTAACRDGRMIAGIGLEAVEVHPTKRASTVLRRIVNPEMAQTANALVSALGCSGFVSFDFIVDAADHAFLIEMNPRPIGSTHLGRLFGHDLMRAFLTGVPARSTPTLAPDTPIALFPKELERDPESAYLRSGKALFDVPDDEPELAAAYLAHLGALHPTHAGMFGNLTQMRADRTSTVAATESRTTEELPLAS